MSAAADDSTVGRTLLAIRCARPHLRSVQPQCDLFAVSPPHPEGLVYAPDFLDHSEEAALLAEISTLPVAEAKYRGFVARRRTMHFGYGYDFTSNRLQPAPPLPAVLLPLREKVAHWSGVAAGAFV